VNPHVSWSPGGSSKHHPKRPETPAQPMRDPVSMRFSVAADSRPAQLTVRMLERADHATHVGGCHRALPQGSPFSPDRRSQSVVRATRPPAYKQSCRCRAGTRSRRMNRSGSSDARLAHVLEARQQELERPKPPRTPASSAPSSTTATETPPTTTASDASPLRLHGRRSLTVPRWQLRAMPG
jgi:hypothetical protein